MLSKEIDACSSLRAAIAVDTKSKGELANMCGDVGSLKSIKAKTVSATTGVSLGLHDLIPYFLLGVLIQLVDTAAHRLFCSSETPATAIAESSMPR